MEKEKTGVGARIREIRGQRTQKEFSALLGIGNSTLIRYEAEERDPDMDFILRLNVLFKVQPLWLLTGWGDEASGVKLKPDEAALLDNYRHCSNEGKNAVKTTVSCLAQQAKGLKKKVA